MLTKLILPQKRKSKCRQSTSQTSHLSLQTIYLKKSNRDKIKIFQHTREGDEFVVVKIENYGLPFLSTHQHLNKFIVYKLNMRPIETNKSSGWMFL